MAFNTKNQDSMKAMAGSVASDSKPLNLICPRYVNKYTLDRKEAQSIMDSIKKEGLIEPITINDISEYLNSKDIDRLPEEGKEYYQKMLEKGYQYFISTGHRRFYAYCSLAIGEEIINETQFDYFTEKFAPIFNASVEAAQFFETDKINPYCDIKCFVAHDNASQELERYNAANLDQRGSGHLELSLVDNAIDEMKWYNLYDKMIEDNKLKRIAEMSERTVYDNVAKFGFNTKDYKTVEEAREVLKTVGADKFSGYYSDLNNGIVAYIQERRKKKIPLQSVDKARKILMTLDKPFVAEIYHCTLDYKKAIELQSYYPNMVKNNVNMDTVLEQIKNKEFNFEEAKAKYSEKEVKVKKVSMSENDWLKIIDRLMKCDPAETEEVRKHLVNLGYKKYEKK